MKERGRYTAWGVFWLFLAVFCMVGGTSAMEAALPEVHGRVACRYGVEGPGFDEVGLLRDIMAEWAGNGLVTGAVTAWTQTSNTLVQCEETAASLELDVLWVDGAADLIWPWKALTGALPVFGAVRDCALDADTARLLFGTTDVVGQTVWVNDASYLVACVFQLPYGLSAWGADPGCGLALLPASAYAYSPFAGTDASSAESGGTGNTIRSLDFDVQPLDAHSPKEWVEVWLNESRISLPRWEDALWQQRRLLAVAAQCGPSVIVLCIVLAVCTAAFKLLRAAVAGARACWLDRLLSSAHGWRLLGIGVAGTAALAALGYWAAGLPRIALNIPPDYLPTRWSDLSFWPALALEQAREQAARQMLGALRPDMIRAHLAGISANLSLLAVPLLLLFWHSLRARAVNSGTLPRTLMTATLAPAFPPLALWCAQKLDWPAAATPGLIPLILVFIAVAQFPAAYPLVKLLTTYHLKNNHEEVSV